MAQWRVLRLAAAAVQNPQRAELIGDIIFFPRTRSKWNEMAAFPGRELVSHSSQMAEKSMTSAAGTC
ncbi:hypothetical protein EB815_33210 [Mesorhizobium loti]|uniref:Uncharacterized protein n=1 Tax=Rhizobium loti TaxID=381 RepID=A0A6M7U7T8_RHILI|nr:hypothetical protein ASE05_27790 [Mesorhizobium sp. Root172]OBQ59003.1 hypothetical protein A8145_25405 [Mesorhizobium loti]QKC73404.1 hypothetical protein EB815_33210 [Mesorhizobium loti]